MAASLGRAARSLWALPCSAVGLVIAAPVLLGGGRATWSDGALEVTHRERLAACGALSRALPFRGIVFGHVILAVTREELAAIGPHERVHVAQYERWGPLFFVAYVASSAWQWLRGRDPYWHNTFEVQARQRSARAAGATGSPGA
ncbi:MAG TPA: signal peptide prediction [Burkholderiaceae bacterium]|nr:signal peptide prediction [Burkholderiaceae bacterium]